MEFQPKTRKEIESDLVLQPGIYDFECVKAEETVSKSGNQMLAIEIRVFKPDGSTTNMRDWLLPIDGMPMEKLLNFCDSVGLSGAFESGKLSAHDLIKRTGVVKTFVKEDPEYGMQARVANYIPYEDDPTVEKKNPIGKQDAAIGPGRGKAMQQMQADDEIPF